MKKDKEISDLIKENKRLRAELAKTEKKLRLLNKETQSDVTSYISGKAVRYSDSNHYIGFLLRSLKASNIYSRFKTLVKIFSRFRIVSFLVKLFTAAVVFLETGAHVILLSTIALITLPITTFLGLITFIVAFLCSNTANRRLASLPDKKNVYIFFPSSVKQFRSNSFFNGWVREIASDKNNLVVIVSPAFWKASGHLKGRYYLHYRKETQNIIMIRKYYFFSFRRNVLKAAKTKSVYMIH